MKFLLRRRAIRLYEKYSDGQTALKEAIIRNNIRRNRIKKSSPYLSLKTAALILRYLFRTPLIWVAVILPLIVNFRMNLSADESNSAAGILALSAMTSIIGISIGASFTCLSQLLYPAITKSWKGSIVLGWAIAAPVVTFLEGMLNEWYNIPARGPEFFHTLAYFLMAICVGGGWYWVDGRWIDPSSSFYKKKRTEERRFEKHADELLYVQAQDQYVLLVYENEQTLLRKSFSTVLKELKFENGLRVHRSYWVNKAAIDSVEKDGQKTMLVLKSGATIPVSKTYRDKLLELSI